MTARRASLHESANRRPASRLVAGTRLRIATECALAHGIFDRMRRQCARPGCSAVATATFTFDSNERTVWLDAVGGDGARAGELCARHARVLLPPRGWHVVDRRTSTSASAPPPPGVTAAPVTTVRTGTATPSTSETAAASSNAAAPAWHPRFERGDTLGGLLDASTPLLARAFENVRTG
jgi:hypothetical protein